MIATFLAWFNSRTARERLLLVVGVYVVLGIGGSLLAWRTAAQFRTEAASDLASAQALESDVAKIAIASGAPGAEPLPASDGSVRGIAMAIATQSGLKPSRTEPSGPNGLHLSFEAAPAAAILGWIEKVERSSLAATRIILVRAGEGDLVTSEITLGERAR